ncbi:transposase [Micromonospora sp. NPDC049799]|uniref:IS110 family transposase n=1 Tax=Micromonospora sp. NPDC049799 TaxID=3154741 RepID=UPI0033FB6D89
MAEVSTHGRPVCWAVDVTPGLSALLLTLLWRRQVQVRYVSGTVAFHMAAAFAGENKTDARDAVVIAQTIRMRPDIPVLEPSDRLLAELTVLTGYRADLVGQRVATLFRQQTVTLPRERAAAVVVGQMASEILAQGAADRRCRRPHRRAAQSAPP